MSSTMTTTSTDLAFQRCINPQCRATLAVDQVAFACPECGDLGCGCVSCAVARDGDVVVWSELGWEADYDPAGVSLFPMGGFRFSGTALAGALGLPSAA